MHFFRVIGATCQNHTPKATVLVSSSWKKNPNNCRWSKVCEMDKWEFWKSLSDFFLRCQEGHQDWRLAGWLSRGAAGRAAKVSAGSRAYLRAGGVGRGLWWMTARLSPQSLTLLLLSGAADGCFLKRCSDDANSASGSDADWSSFNPTSLSAIEKCGL